MHDKIPKFVSSFFIILISLKLNNEYAMVVFFDLSKALMRSISEY